MDAAQQQFSADDAEMEAELKAMAQEAETARAQGRTPSPRDETAITMQVSAENLEGGMAGGGAATGGAQSETEAWLATRGLAQYAGALEREGFDDLEELGAMQPVSTVPRRHPLHP